MHWKKGWIFFISLFTLLSPLGLEAKVNLSNMNLLEKVETRSTADELIIKFNFKKRLGHFKQPVFFKKSIQVDFPFVYSQPAKQFLKTGNSQISQIYVSQFNARTMRVRFILGKGEEGDYKNRFNLQKEDNSLTVRVDRKQVDILDRLLARTTAKIEEKKQKESLNDVSADVVNKRSIESRPARIKVKKSVLSNSGDLKKGLSEKIKTASYNKEPKWKSDKKKLEESLSPVKKISFGLLKSGDKNKSNPIDLVSSGFKMIMTLSLVLGLIFLLFFGFKKYVLKNTVFGGGGKQVQVLSTNFLAPKKNIALVEVAGEILVLGISDQNISLLTSIREPTRIDEIKNAHEDNSSNTDWKQGISGNVAGNSPASSNAAKVFSKYIKQFSGSESDKQTSVAAVTEKIRRRMGKVRTA